MKIFRQIAKPPKIAKMFAAKKVIEMQMMIVITLWLIYVKNDSKTNNIYTA